MVVASAQSSFGGPRQVDEKGYEVKSFKFTQLLGSLVIRSTIITTSNVDGAAGVRVMSKLKLPPVTSTGVSKIAHEGDPGAPTDILPSKLQSITPAIFVVPQPADEGVRLTI